MDNTYVPYIGDHVFLHQENNSAVGRFFAVLDVQGDTMSIQACEINGDHLEEIDNLDVILLNFDKKTGQWVWNRDRDKAKLVATFMQQTEKV